MRTTQANRLTQFHAVLSFLDAHAARLPDTTASPARRRLDAIVADLQRNATAQEGLTMAARTETRRYQALRRALVQDHIEPIVVVARSVLVAEPGVEVFTMLRGNPPVALLVARAHGLAGAIKPLAPAFIAAGLPDDFIAQLNRAADAVDASYMVRRARRCSSQAATTGIQLGLGDARTVVRVLGVLVRKEAAADPAVLAEWNALASPRRLRATVSKAALPAATAALALPAPTMKLLASGPSTANAEARGLASLLGPLNWLIARKRTA